jgi:hypothetical protein
VPIKSESFFRIAAYLPLLRKFQLFEVWRLNLLDLQFAFAGNLFVLQAVITVRGGHSGVAPSRWE